MRKLTLTKDSKRIAKTKISNVPGLNQRLDEAYPTRIPTIDAREITPPPQTVFLA